MAKTISQWKCEPCGHLNEGEKPGEICLVCGNPGSPVGIKIIRKEGKYKSASLIIKDQTSVVKDSKT